jgi:formate hydrogenlyase subunit 3/multisubunit Na+/H+ antiporter MnhD subunit
VSGDLWVILPLACLAGGAFAVYILGRTLNAANALLALFTAVVFATSLATAGPLFVEAGKASLAGGELPRWGYLQADGAVLRADPGAVVIIVIALGLGMLVTVYSGRYLALDHRYEAYYPLLLLLVIGLCGMVLAADLFNLYMFCELMSVAAYALVSFRRHTDTAIEAGFKYLIMGSLATVIILMGISFVYRETGHLDLLRMAEVSSGGRRFLGDRGFALAWHVSWSGWASRAPSFRCTPGCQTRMAVRPAASAQCCRASLCRVRSMCC